MLEFKFNYCKKVAKCLIYAVGVYYIVVMFLYQN